MPQPGSLEDLDNRFSYHAPKDDLTKNAHELVRHECLKLALVIRNTVPAGQEQAVAYTKLEEVMFWANAGIARN